MSDSQGGAFMEAARMTPHRLLMLSLLGASVVWGYWPVLAEMADKWFADPQYSHAYLVPLFSAYLLWRGRKDAPRESDGPVWWGVAFLLGGVLLRLMGSFYSFTWLQAYSLMPVLWGASLLLGGWPAFRWSFWPIAFLFFMVPLPFRIENLLSQPLQRLATYLSVYALQTFGWPAFQEGNVIVLNAHRIGIVTACNGLGMLILFFALAAGVATLIQRPWIDRAVVVLSAAPIAILSNVIRIVTTTMCYEVAGKYWGDLLFHELAGWIMMPIALCLLWLELLALSWLFVPAPAEDPLELDFSQEEEVQLEYARR
jgi:exosortase